MGILTKRSGENYEGKFPLNSYLNALTMIEGKYNGEGTLIMNDGEKKEGRFENGILALGAISQNNEDYFGELSEGKYHGTGKLVK